MKSVNKHNFIRWYAVTAATDTRITNIYAPQSCEPHKAFAHFFPNDWYSFVVNVELQSFDYTIDLVDANDVSEVVEQSIVVPVPIVQKSGKYFLWVTFRNPVDTIGLCRFALKRDGNYEYLSNPVMFDRDDRARELVNKVVYLDDRPVDEFDYPSGQFYTELHLPISRKSMDYESDLKQYRNISDRLRRNVHFDTDKIYRLDTYFFNDGDNDATAFMFRHKYIVLNGVRVIPKDGYTVEEHRASYVSKGRITVYEVGTGASGLPPFLLSRWIAMRNECEVVKNESPPINTDIVQTNKTDGSFYGGTTAGDGTIYFCGGGIWKIDGATGDIVQTNKTDGTHHFGVTASDGTAYFGSENNGVWKVDGATGDIVQTNKTDGSFYGGITASDGTTYLCSFGLGVWKIDGATGDIVQTNKTNGAFNSGVTASDGTTYLCGDNNGVWKVDGATGDIVQTNKTNGSFGCGVTASDGTTYFCGYGSGMWKVDGATGDIVQTNKTDGAFNYGVTTGNGVSYFCGYGIGVWKVFDSAPPPVPTGFRTVPLIGKTDANTGEPVDKGGALCSESGNPQEVQVAREYYGAVAPGTTVNVDGKDKYVSDTYSVKPEGELSSDAVITINGIPVYYYDPSCLDDAQVNRTVDAEWSGANCEIMDSSWGVTPTPYPQYTGYARMLLLTVTKKTNGVLESRNIYSALEYSGLSLNALAMLPPTDYDTLVNDFVTFVLTSENVSASNVNFTNTNRESTINCNMFKGMIVAFTGARYEIPPQWFICDGSHGTKDLRGRCPVGQLTDNDAGGLFAFGDNTFLEYFMFPETNPYKVIGNKFGKTRHVLTAAEMPLHKHSLQGSGSRDLGGMGTIMQNGRSGGDVHDPNGEGNKGNISAEGIGAVGGNQPHENRPPSTVVLWLMYSPDIPWTPYT